MGNFLAKQRKTEINNLFRHTLGEDITIQSIYLTEAMKSLMKQ